MNQRIRELATEVGISVDYLTNTKQIVLLEKFALLIVSECASRVDNILREKKDGGGTMGDDIREHFGVEPCYHKS